MGLEYRSDGQQLWSYMLDHHPCVPLDIALLFCFPPGKMWTSPFTCITSTTCASLWREIQHTLVSDADFIQYSHPSSMNKIKILELIHKLLLIYFSQALSLSKIWGPSGSSPAWQSFLAAHTYCDGHTVQHRFSQSRFNWSSFVCIAVLQKHLALPSPQDYSVRVGIRREKRKGKLAKQQERRGAKPQHAPWGAAGAAVHAAGKTNCSSSNVILQALKWLHAHKQTTACSLATQTNAEALLSHSVQPKTAFHPWAVVRAAVELLFYMCIYTSSHCTHSTASSHTNSFPPPPWKTRIWISLLSAGKSSISPGHDKKWSRAGIHTAIRS